MGHTTEIRRRLAAPRIPRSADGIDSRYRADARAPLRLTRNFDRSTRAIATPIDIAASAYFADVKPSGLLKITKFIDIIRDDDCRMSSRYHIIRKEQISSSTMIFALIARSLILHQSLPAKCTTF